MNNVEISDNSSPHDDSFEESLHTSKKIKQTVDLSQKGFRLTGAAKEKHSSKLYSVAWSSDLFCSVTEDNVIRYESDGSSHFRYFATCGGKYISLYEVEVDIQKNELSERPIQNYDGFRARQIYVDADDDEDYYTCVFAGRGVGSSVGYGPISRGHENKDGYVTLDSSGDTMVNCDKFDVSKNDGPQLLLAAGERGIIKIIDTVYRRLFLTLSGHGDSIYDIKVSPCDTWLLLSASKDESIRLWNIMNATCIAIFTGHEGHKSSVLSISWHPLGKRFVSSSMDTSIKIWNLDTHPIQENIVKSHSISPRSMMVQEGDAENTITFKPVFEQLPIFSTNKMHIDYGRLCIYFSN